MEIVERVRLLCKEKGIAISKMEKDLGYGNGYFNPKKLRAIPSSRLKEIATSSETSGFCSELRIYSARRPEMRSRTCENPL